MTPAVHQFVPRLEPGAVGVHVLQGQAALRAAGYESEVFASEVDAAFVAAARARETDVVLDFEEYARRARPDDVLVYHLAIGAVLADRLAARSETLVVDHHNLTPAELLEPWDPGVGSAVAWGRRQLGALASRCRLGLADSRFNEDELLAAGYRATATVPVMLDPTVVEPDPDTVARLGAGKAGTDWLFVGRLAPNKAQHDLLAAFAMYVRAHDPTARLWLVGGSASDRYTAALRGLVETLGLVDRVEFVGASPAALAAYYDQADVFVCLSDHEGFCVPLLEAWSHAVPVVAFAAGAVPETLGDAGLVLHDKSPAVVAASVQRVVADAGLRSTLVAHGTRRLRGAFDPAQVRQRFVAALESTM